jgi:hypothetical protein
VWRLSNRATGFVVFLGHKAQSYGTNGSGLIVCMRDQEGSFFDFFLYFLIFLVNVEGTH